MVIFTSSNIIQILEALFQSAYELFLEHGISKTTIHDIVQKAGVAKGTFYLYFKDKYDIRDRLIARTARKLFLSAHTALLSENITTFEDKIIFIVDYIIVALQKNKPILQFLSKNLSWGIFKCAANFKSSDTETSLMQLFDNLAAEEPNIQIRNPEIALFLIIELASSASYSTILENDPVSFEELKPDLYNALRQIIRSHIIETN